MKTICTIFNKIRKLRKNIFLLAVSTAVPFFLSAQKPATQNQAREFVLQGKIQEAIIAYAQLSSKEADNTTILMEYAYSLALGSMPEGSLMYLDLAKQSGAGNEYYFYAARVLELTGHKSLAVSFRETVGNAPSWLYDSRAEHLMRHSPPVRINRDEDSTVYKRANTLAAKGMYLQSLVLLQELIDKYPDLYLPYLSASITLENLQLFDRAEESLGKSIELIDETLKRGYDSDLSEALPAFKTHLEGLKQKITEVSYSSTFEKLKEKYHPRAMLYAGGMYSDSFFSLNSRFGVFIADSWNAAADLGISRGSGSTFGNIGVSMYNRKDWWIYGAGLSGQFGESSSLNFRLTSGVSFFNKEKNRSTDIFLTADIPFQKDAKTTFGISIGRSFYFGKR
jgi:tetratricopeptide (TPR) repeat protein